MKIRIKETGEIRELKAIGTNGIEWTNDLLGNHDATHYNEETEEHEMSIEDFEWWEEYIENEESDREEIEELAEDLGIDENEIWERINEQITTDLGDEHGIKQNVIAEIREENKKEYDVSYIEQQLDYLNENGYNAELDPTTDYLIVTKK